MGSSGAGKTTLLNALAFRSPPGVRIAPSAIRALNGAQIDATELRSRCAYVQQDDLFIGSLTAREHLIFQAMVRMDRELTHKQKVRRVDEVLLEVSIGSLNFILHLSNFFVKTSYPWVNVNTQSLEFLVELKDYQVVKEND